ncbi:SUMF1/EgtB/PvdO family nonheme iron enzyme [Scytonema sp. NUACC26]|uniref:bifunctional serine/threonine-protein kinase/formylglycine-generating enzyme family protein n=1 Tax=Scytonema sp. NUACC26 TaxID=3140176 RepID=UPI0034DB97C6
MLICQNPECSNPFNSDGNKFCTSCGQSHFSNLLRHRYRVKRLLGEGGFGKTYAATDVDRLDAPCVIKQFFPPIQGTARIKSAELFKEEAKRLYELGEDHPQIPRLLAYFEQSTSLYLVQEFIEGQTLVQEVRQHSFEESHIRELLLDLLPVLQFIHERNVIHRDIKPENIIRRKSDGKLVLIDFGGAKQVTQTTLKPGTVIYTPGYAPVEQIQGYVCEASDLYALGVTCVRLLTQCLPSADVTGNFFDKLYDAYNAQWLWREYLQEKGISISKDLGEVLDKLLQHFAKDRYQSAKEALQHLQGKQKLEFKSFDFYVVNVDPRGQEISRALHNANFFVQDLGNEATLEMVAIPGSSFMMGAPENEGFHDEYPQHIVTVEPFFMSKFPITQAQWQAVAALPSVNKQLNPDPSSFKGANRPVENILWYDAQEFCARLLQITKRNYRLPSEAEWEYACRATTTTPFHFGETITTHLANYNGDYVYAGIHTFKKSTTGKHRKQTTPVGSFNIANAFGLYDMHGLVWEWCADPWHENYLGAPNDGSVWELGGDCDRWVLRGGSWSDHPAKCRSANRRKNESGEYGTCGFRVALSSLT